MSDFFRCPLSYYAKKTPAAIALVHGENNYSYRQCHDLTAHFSKKLQSIGIKKGDKIAFLPSDWRAPLLFFALFRLQAVACPLNARYPAATLPRLLDKMGASLILASASFCKELPPIKQEKISFESFFEPAGSPSRSHSEMLLDKSALATFLSTSGTTALPKIAAHSIGNHYYSALGLHQSLNIEPTSRYLLSLPLHHVSGISIIWRMFLKGATLVTYDKTLTLAMSIVKYKISHISMVQTQLIEFLNEFPANSHAIASRIKSILLGGSSLMPSYCKKAWEWGLPVFPSYGSTEMSSTITVCRAESAHTFSAGFTLPYREIKIDAHHRILARGKTLFQGYLDERGSIKLPPLKEDFFYTKDLGRFDSKRGLYVLGREDRMFISGGENIHPEEIELALLALPHIQTATVIPFSCEKYGSIPTAQISTSKSITAPAIQELLKKSLPGYKIPKTIKITTTT